uniref:Secreted protein n=1 Tax=Heterorhabditis bacteriophora TaxID=37862 RepID=A0A1I7X9M8_HETBA
MLQISIFYLALWFVSVLLYLVICVYFLETTPPPAEVRHNIKWDFGYWTGTSKRMRQLIGTLVPLDPNGSCWKSLERRIYAQFFISALYLYINKYN